MYGLLISTGIFLSIIIGEKIVKKENKSPEVLWNLSFWVILGGVTGARIYHVIDSFEYYQSHLLQILQIWRGGLGIYGGILGGLIAGTVYLSKNQLQKGYWLSIVATIVPLAQSLGRWGNFFNQELYGKVTTLPWGILIKEKKYHPLFLYESIANLILFFVLLNLRKKFPNTTIFLYIVGYTIIRFFLEFLRIDPWTVFGLNVAQIISILGLTVSIIAFLKLEEK